MRRHKHKHCRASSTLIVYLDWKGTKLEAEVHYDPPEFDKGYLMTGESFVVESVKHTQRSSKTGKCKELSEGWIEKHQVELVELALDKLEDQPEYDEYEPY